MCHGSLGVGDGNIIAVGNDIETVTLEALEKMVDEDASILTIYFGEEVSETNAAALAERLANSYKDVEIEMHGGGQPLYYYVISIE